MDADRDYCRSPCPNCAAGKGFWKVCMRAPTIPGQTKDVFGGICPSCLYKRTGNTCVPSSEPTAVEDLQPPRSTVTTNEFMPTRLLPGPHAEATHSARHGITAPQHISPAFATSATLGQVPRVSKSHNKRKRDSGALSARDAPMRQHHGMPVSQDQPESMVRQTTSPNHDAHAHDGTAYQEQTTTGLDQALPAGGQAVDHAGPGFQDIAWDLFNHARDLDPSQRAAFPDRIEAAFSLVDLGPDVLGTINYIFQLPPERQIEDRRKIITLLRHLMD